MNRKLIINADDFGIAEETNRAVRELYKGGKITSTSLLTCGEGAGEAVSYIKEDGIPFGIHLTLNSDFALYPWRAHAGKSSLTDEAEMLLYDTALLAQRAKGRDVTAECEAQIAYALERGIMPDHLDNHCGTMYGINLRAFFINAFRLSKKYALPFRFPKDNAFLKGYFKGSVPSYIKAAHKGIVLCGKMMDATLIDNMITNPYARKDIPNYKALEEYYLKEITGIKEGVTEMFLHPSYDATKLSATTEEWKKRQYELDFLWSPALENRLKDEGITIIGYNF